MIIVKNCWRALSLFGCALTSLGHSLAGVKIWRAAPSRGRNMVFQKVDLGWSKSISPPLELRC